MYDEVSDVCIVMLYTGADYTAIVQATQGSTCMCPLPWLSVQRPTLLCRCVLNQHLCGNPCKFSGRHGCLGVCAKVCAFV